MAEAGKRNIFNDMCQPEAVEGVALQADILPGMMVTPTAAGYNKNAKASTVFGFQPLFADKDLIRMTSVNTVLVQNENMVARPLAANESANVLVATGQTINAPRLPLASNGDGSLKLAATDGTDYVVAYSDEIITTTAATLVRVRGV